MLIDIPVTICFDHDSTWRAPHSAGRVFTMRYDTVDTDKKAQWTTDYPPKPNSHWITDEQGVLFDLLTSEADRAIRRRAEQEPTDYAAKVA